MVFWKWAKFGKRPRWESDYFRVECVGSDEEIFDFVADLEAVFAFTAIEGIGFHGEECYSLR